MKVTKLRVGDIVETQGLGKATILRLLKKEKKAKVMLHEMKYLLIERCYIDTSLITSIVSREVMYVIDYFKNDDTYYLEYCSLAEARKEFKKLIKRDDIKSLRICKRLRDTYEILEEIDSVDYLS